MSAKQPWVYRRYITIERRVEYQRERPGRVATTSESWLAIFSGPMSTGETLSLSDVGVTYAEALGNLEKSLRSMGLEIRA